MLTIVESRWWLYRCLLYYPFNFSMLKIFHTQKLRERGEVFSEIFSLEEIKCTLKFKEAP